MSAQLESLEKLVVQIEQLARRNAALEEENKRLLVRCVQIETHTRRALDPSKVAELLDVSRATVAAWIENGKIPAQPLPGGAENTGKRTHWRVWTDELFAVLEQLRKETRP